MTLVPVTGWCWSVNVIYHALCFSFYIYIGTNNVEPHVRRGDSHHHLADALLALMGRLQHLSPGLEVIFSGILPRLRDHASTGHCVPVTGWCWSVNVIYPPDHNVPGCGRVDRTSALFADVRYAFLYPSLS